MTDLMRGNIAERRKPAILGGPPAFSEGIPLMRPSVPSPEELLPVLTELQSTGYISNFGPHSRSLEEMIAQRLGVGHCVTLSNLSTGLMYMPAAAQLDGGEVILPSFTFLATAHSMKLAGLEPVFADIDPETLTLDPRSVAAAVTTHTVAVCAVHIYGTPCDIQGLQSVCDRHGLALFFDAAHALGSSYQGHPIGGFGTAEGFSTSATKVVSTLGEGGFITTNDAGVDERIRRLRNWGHGGDYNADMISICSKLPEFSAAAGLIELERLDDYMLARQSIAARYEHGLEAVPGIRFPQVREGDVSSYKDIAILVDAEQFGMTSTMLEKALETEGVQTRRYFSPSLHQMDCYRKLNTGRHVPLEYTERASREVICLPIYNAMDLEAVDRICACIGDLHRHAFEISWNDKE